MPDSRKRKPIATIDRMDWGMYLRPMRFFYAPVVNTPVHVLEEGEAKHLARVLRARVGDEVLLTDGKGGRYEGQITALDKRQCAISILHVAQVAPVSPRLTLVVAPTKATDRFEWLLEKATEIGVSAIQPVWTERSERRQEKGDRWQRILVSALKQSQRFWLPELKAAMDFRGFLESSSSDAAGKFIAHCEASASADEKKHLLRAMVPGQDSWVAIGPEGDFALEEIAAARAVGAKEVSLGDARLRTETAGLAAVHLMQLAQLA